jgi:zinc protease
MKPFVETSHALPIVSVAIALRSGSAHDPQGKEGLARVAARMLRRGGGGKTADQIEDAVDSLGGEFGADVATSSTSIHFEVIRRNLEPFVELISRVLAEPSFDKEELGRLIRESQSEIVEVRDNDRALASRAFRRTLFANHPYGRRIGGTIDSLGAIRAEDVRAHYAKHFTRNNALVAVSGDIDEKESAVLVEKLFARLPAGEAIADPVEEPKPIRGRTLVFVDKPERTQTQMVIGGLGTHSHDADHFDLMLGNTVFGGTFTSRLMAEVRSKRGWSYGASSGMRVDRRRESLTLWTAPAATDAPACLGLELDLLKAIRESGITAEELAFAKNYLHRSHAFEIDTARKRVHQKLEEDLTELPAGYYASYLPNIGKATLEGVNAALKRRMPEDDLIVGVVGEYEEIGKKIEQAIPNLDRVIVNRFDFE